MTPLLRRPRRAAVALFFGSVSVNAVLGVVALAGVGLGGMGGRLLGTSLSVTGALVLALLCLPAHERHLLGRVPALSAATGALAFAIAVISLWTDGGEGLGRVAGTLFTVGVAGMLASLSALATLRGPRARVRAAAYALLAVSVVLLLVLIWAGIGSEWYGRALGVVLVVLAATLVSLPVLHRLTPAGPPGQGAVGHCPYCGGRALRPAGDALLCPACERTFVVIERLTAIGPVAGDRRGAAPST